VAGDESLVGAPCRVARRDAVAAPLWTNLLLKRRLRWPGGLPSPSPRGAVHVGRQNGWQASDAGRQRARSRAVQAAAPKASDIHTRLVTPHLSEGRRPAPRGAPPPQNRRALGVHASGPWRPHTGTSGARRINPISASAELTAARARALSIDRRATLVYSQWLRQWSLKGFATKKCRPPPPLNQPFTGPIWPVEGFVPAGLALDGRNSAKDEPPRHAGARDSPPQTRASAGRGAADSAGLAQGAAQLFPRSRATSLASRATLAPPPSRSAEPAMRWPAGHLAPNKWQNVLSAEICARLASLLVGPCRRSGHDTLASKRRRGTLLRWDHRTGSFMLCNRITDFWPNYVVRPVKDTSCMDGTDSMHAFNFFELIHELIHELITLGRMHLICIL